MHFTEFLTNGRPEVLLSVSWNDSVFASKVVNYVSNSEDIHRNNQDTEWPQFIRQNSTYPKHCVYEMQGIGLLYLKEWLITLNISQCERHL
jgi:hypothetical protein